MKIVCVTYDWSASEWERTVRTPVAIIGGGAAGLLLQQLLHVGGVGSIVLEHRSREYVEGRIRAGVPEQLTVDFHARVRVDARLRQDGPLHEGYSFAVDGRRSRINRRELTGGYSVVVYGQTEVTHDLNEAVVSRGRPVIFEAKKVAPYGLDEDWPRVTWRGASGEQRLDCDYVAGCDGYHGVSRSSIAEGVLKTYARVYPFGWLGVLTDVPACDPDPIYSSHARVFALASMRSPSRSRYYVQAPPETDLAGWPDERIWDELAAHVEPKTAGMTCGPSIEKSITSLRSLVTEPMRWKRLLLAGARAHIVLPTGAKRVSLAASGVHHLSEALVESFRSGWSAGLDTYSAEAVAGVCKAERLSWWFTGLTHRFPETDPVARQMQLAELDYVRSSRPAQMTVAENYVGLPLA